MASALVVTSLSTTSPIAALYASANRSTPTGPGTIEATRSSSALGTVPMYFEHATQGDVTGFVARGQGYNVAVSGAGAAVTLRGHAGARAAVSFLVDGATGAAVVSGDAQQPGVVHRYGGPGERWQEGAQTYGRVVARGVRPGIDVVYYGNQRQLEYDFVIAPGARPADAAMIVDGAERVEIAANGDLLLHVAGKVLRQQAPVAYQDVDGSRRPVASAFTYDASTRRIGFDVGAYDHDLPLVIDPVLVYSSWFGGLSEEAILDIAVDANGFIYVLGYSDDKLGFPTTPGAFQPQRGGAPDPSGTFKSDVFVSKFNPAGTALVYSTYLGGSENEVINTFSGAGGLKVDAQGRVYVVGDTMSPDFPVTPDAADGSFASDAVSRSDAFYARLDADGSLGYSTFIGGTDTEYANGIDIDTAGNAYIVGYTTSTPAEGFATTANAYRTTLSGGADLFIQRYSPAGALMYSTYFGGNQGESSRGADIAVDEAGRVVVVSDLFATDLPVTPNAFQSARSGNSTDVFLARIDTNVPGTAGLLYCSYFGGGGNDQARGIDMDAAGHVYIVGDTPSANFPVTAGAYDTSLNDHDVFVAKFDLSKNNAASLVYSTFIGGDFTENGYDIAVDGQGRAHVVGNTYANNFPLIGAVQTTRYQTSPFVSIVNPTGTALTFSSYLSSNTNGQVLNSVAVNQAGETFVAGATNDDDHTAQRPDAFKLVNAFQTVYGGGDLDAVIQKLGFSVDLSLTKLANVAVLLPGQNVTFTLQVVNPSSDPASGVVVTDNLPAGLEYVSCTASLGGICNGTGNARSISFAQLAPGATATMQIVAKMTATTPGQQITNTATVTAGVLDPVPANNTASANVSLPTLDPSGDADGDGLSNEFETAYGLDPFGGPGSGPNDDPDGDGKTNLQELNEGTHPRGFVITYLAEGATGNFFDTRLAIANPSARPALVLTRFQRADGVTIRDYRVVPAMSRATIDVETIPGLEAAEFSTLIEADEQVVADRTMTWDQSGYGSHAERGILTRTATKWYFAEGATFFNFNLFYLIQNPNDQAAQVKVTYLLPTGAPLVKTYVVGPQSRANIWVDSEGENDPALAPLAAAELSAVIESTNGVPIIAERAMYLNRPGQPLGAGHESAGVTAPATQWFLAEGATGNYFDLFILIANPQDTAATVQADFL
ncbi:MAG TPA: SBBP repeat-containing protein, partial [Luteitalea sp.]|nr:SBBP repeat-containing protein [Luteitalea sp.]